MTGAEVLIAAQVAGTAMAAVGAIQQGNQAKASANFNAQVANNNAIASRQQAEANAARQERESRLRAGSVAANVGASGGTMSGSALDLMESNAAQEELDRLTILHGGELQASGFESEAALARQRGSAAQSSARAQAGSSLLLGGAKAFGGSGSGAKQASVKSAALAPKFQTSGFA